MSCPFSRVSQHRAQASVVEIVSVPAPFLFFEDPEGMVVELLVLLLIAHCSGLLNLVRGSLKGAQKYALPKFRHLLCNLSLNVPKFRHLHQF